jgi:hypothetical protein
MTSTSNTTKAASVGLPKLIWSRLKGRGLFSFLLLEIKRLLLNPSARSSFQQSQPCFRVNSFAAQHTPNSVSIYARLAGEFFYRYRFQFLV